MNADTQTINKSAIRDGKYLPTLDGWRAIAIILVMIGHGSDSISRAFDLCLNQFHYVGLLGVQIFFGLSGLLITSRLIADEKKRGRISLRFFYLRRAFRILPASLVFLLIVGVLSIIGVLPITLGRWLSTLLFFSNYSTAEGTWYVGHFWSLAVEEHFYFIWPLAFLLLKNVKRRAAATICAALVIALWRAIDFKYHITSSTPDVFWGRTDIQVDGIIWGVVVALLYSDKAWRDRLDRLLNFPLVMPLMLMAFIIIVTLPAIDWKVKFSLLTIKAIIVPLLMLGTIIKANRLLYYVLEASLFKLIGRVSYSIYLWQQLFLVWNASAIYKLSLLQTFPLNLVAVMMLSSISFVFVEKPLIALGHKIARNPTHK